jgi:hypothetical protein
MRNPSYARSTKALLERQAGVRSVEIRPLTGSLVIHYDPASADPAALVALVPPVPRKPSTLPRPAGLSDAAAKAVIGAAVQAAVERSLLALAAVLL